MFLVAGCGSDSQPAAKVLKVSGQVNARAAAGEAFKQAAPDMQLKVGGQSVPAARPVPACRHFWIR